MKTFVLVSLSLLLSLQVFSRRFPGYIIVAEGDTLHGYIFIGSESQMSQEIGFSPTKTTSPKRTYQPKDILEFQFLGSRFVSAKVSAEEELVKELTETFERPQAHIRHVFLALDVEGTASLYYFRENSEQKHYYVKMEKGDFQELIKYTYYEKSPEDQKKANETTKIKVTENRYRTVLENLFIDCADIAKSTSKVSLGREDLIRVFKKYNECIDGNQTPLYVNPHGSGLDVSLNIELGTSMTKVEFSTANEPSRSYHLTSIDFPVKTVPTLGINLRFQFPNFQPRWFVSLGLWNNQYSIQADYKKGWPTSIASGNYDLQSYETYIRQFAIPVEFGHLIRIGKIEWTISGGGAASITQMKDNRLVTQRYVSNEPIFSPEEARLFSFFQDIEFSIFGSTGIMYKRWGLKSYVVFNQGFLSPNNLVSVKSRYLRIVLTYQILN